MKTNQKGLDLIKSFEGLRLHSYQDSVGIWTIGYGSTGADIIAGMTWTEAQADARMAQDLAKFEQGVSEALTVTVTENQFAAMVALAYNVGLGNFKSSTLLKKVNAQDFAEAAKQFLRWNKAGGKVLAGLTRRREAEKALFEE
jgi:lysozyme